MFRLDSGNVLRAEALEQIPWLQHGFGTGASESWPGDLPLATLKQIHSDRILIARGPGLQGEGDALITNQPGFVLSVRTADCLPVLMADMKNRAVAAVHAGWRGTAAGIVPRTISAMRDQFGTQPQDLVVAIGPGIGKCCFEVGPEVAIQFASFFPERQDLSQRTKVDLVETTRRQLRRNDGSVRQIASSDLCSCCHTGTLLHSYRRDKGAAGRMIAAIGLK